MLSGQAMWLPIPGEIYSQILIASTTHFCTENFHGFIISRESIQEFFFFQTKNEFILIQSSFDWFPLAGDYWYAVLMSVKRPRRNLLLWNSRICHDWVI